MVRTWAEKEMRNLKRMCSAGIPCPVPHLLKSHVLVMDFLGKNGWCAPRIRDAELTDEQYIACYQSIAIDMRRLYHNCNLVHGDLSEYNILWHNERPVIIDVSQSVEHAHPFASEFLRKDVTNITEFFAKKGCEVLSKMELFRYVTVKESLLPAELKTSVDSSASLEERFFHYCLEESSRKEIDKEKEWMEYVRQTAATSLGKSGKGNQVTPDGADDSDEEESDGEDSEESDEEVERQLESGVYDYDQNYMVAEAWKEKQAMIENKEAVEEAVFMQAYIPTSLHEFSNPYKENERLQTGFRENVVKNAILDMIANQVVDEKDKTKDENNSDNSNDDSDSGSDSDSAEGDSYDSEEEDYKYRKQLPSHADPEQRQREKEARKAAKKEMKTEKAIKRQTSKVPKHIKKRAMKSKHKK